MDVGDKYCSTNLASIYSGATYLGEPAYVGNGGKLPMTTDSTDLALLDELDIEIDDELPSDETTLLARIPLLAGSNKKAAYLAYRSTGFTPTQSCQLAEITLTTVHRWRKQDLEFAKFEREELQRLQDSVGNDVIRYEFLRNMRMLLKVDMRLITKGITNLEGMSPREFEIFKALRKFYTPQDLLALEKVLHPEKHKDGPLTIKLSWGSRISIDSLRDDDIIDGEVRDVTNDGGEDSP